MKYLKYFLTTFFFIIFNTVLVLLFKKPSEIIGIYSSTSLYKGVINASIYFITHYVVIFSFNIIFFCITLFFFIYLIRVKNNLQFYSILSLNIAISLSFLPVLYIFNNAYITDKTGLKYTPFFIVVGLIFIAVAGLIILFFYFKDKYKKDLIGF